MKLDRNGYAPSIFPLEQDTCYECGKGGYGEVIRHEIYKGNPNRTISKQNGFWITLCPSCHNIVHEKPDDGELDDKLKRECFKRYCETHSREDFYKLIGKYYD